MKNWKLTSMILEPSAFGIMKLSTLPSDLSLLEICSVLDLCWINLKWYLFPLLLQAWISNIPEDPSSPVRLSRRVWCLSQRPGGKTTGKYDTAKHVFKGDKSLQGTVRSGDTSLHGTKRIHGACLVGSCFHDESPVIPGESKMSTEWPGDESWKHDHTRHKPWILILTRYST